MALCGRTRGRDRIFFALARRRGRCVLGHNQKIREHSVIQIYQNQIFESKNLT